MTADTEKAYGKSGAVLPIDCLLAPASRPRVLDTQQKTSDEGALDAITATHAAWF
jgi:hypothetical protein